MTISTIEKSVTDTPAAISPGQASVITVKVTTAEEVTILKIHGVS